MAKTLISTHTASSSATLDITSGITSSYPVYEFHFVSIHAQTLHADFQFQVNASDDTGGGFDTSLITSTFFRTYANEGDSDAAGPDYKTDRDLAQSASFQDLSYAIDQDDGDESLVGMLTLYDPSSTTFAKHFTSRTNANHHSGEYTLECFAAGYINQTLAIPEISFKFHSGNIDAGVIKMYGVS
jgi:hypothetical protein